MNSTDPSRRTLLFALLASPLARAAGVGLLSIPALLHAADHSAAAHHAAAALTTLGADEAREFTAIAARILPSDDTPGATEGGVIYFIDHVLGSSRSELLEPLRAGLASLQAEAHGSFGVKRFSELDALRQDALLQSIEATPFFETMRFLTLAGMFTLPEYGGNREHVGWDLIGFDHRHAWQPPFGYYDADYLQRGE
ncbi:MAG TPA: gluconate 2-dehydrogenase subunit 3 family protein [Pseudomonadales bacterium]